MPAGMCLADDRRRRLRAALTRFEAVVEAATEGLIAVLDEIDGDADFEPDADREPDPGEAAA